MSELLGIAIPSLPQVIAGLTGSVILYSRIKNMVSNKSTDNKICKSDELKNLQGDGILCSKNIRLSVKQSNEHLLMTAPSGIGKTRKVIMHNVKKLNNCSMVVTDPSGEIQKACKTNKIAYIINPFSNDTCGYDILINCKNEFEVRKIAKVLLINGMASTGDKGKSNQEEWVNMATPLLSSYMLMNYHTKKYKFNEMIKNICTLPIVSEMVKDENGNVVKATRSIELEILMSNVESAITEFRSFKQVIEAKQTLSGIRIVMNSCLRMFLDPNLKNIFNRPSIKISKIRKEESIVYIQFPEQHSEYYSPLIATLLTQMFDNYLDNDGLQLYFLFDEFATGCGIIPSISRILSTARKHKISIVAAIQNLTQLKSLYGEVGGKEITELFKTLLICGGLRDSAEYISEILGTEEYTENDITHTKPLMTPDEIRRLEENKMLVICNNKRPVIDDMMEIVV